MDGNIARFHYQYRVLHGDRASAVAVAARLDGIARQELMEYYAEALDGALGEDPSVYVVRRIGYELSLARVADTPNGALARVWGRRMARSVVESIAGTRGSASDIVRFADQAEYVARFIVDLLHGDAWNRWWYGSFAPLRPLGDVEALRTVLERSQAQLPQILGILHSAGVLETLIGRLEEGTRRWLWFALSDDHRIDTSAAEHLVGMGVMLLDRLQLWAGARLDPHAIAAEMCAASVLSADWRDRRSLALAVLAVVQFARQRGYLLPTEGISGLGSRIQDGTVDMDWLDVATLQQGLAIMFSSQRVEIVPGQLPGRPFAAGATPRQQAFLTELLVLLRHWEGSIADPWSPESALRVYAAYIASHPERAGDPLVTELIRRLLEGVAWIGRSSSARLALERLRRYDVDGALQLLAEDDRLRATPALRFIADLGESAAQVAVELVHEADSADTADAETVDSRSAGVALLIRALLDSRLHRLVEDRHGLFLALFSRWAGQDADAGLRLLAGVPDAELTPSLGLPTGFDAAWLDVLHGLRLFTADAVFLHQITLTDGVAALVLGDGVIATWPLGCIIRSRSEIAPAVERWLAAWSTSSDAQPTLVVDRALGSTLAGIDIAQTTIAEDDSDLLPAYQSNRDLLIGTLEALSANQPGRPDDDLQVSLIASTVVRLWTRWLSRFSESSTPYVLRELIRRAGTIHPHGEGLTVDLEPMPLDIVLELSGYLEEIARVPWLDGRSIRFRIKERGVT